MKSIKNVYLQQQKLCQKRYLKLLGTKKDL